MCYSGKWTPIISDSEISSFYSSPVHWLLIELGSWKVSKSAVKCSMANVLAAVPVEGSPRARDRCLTERPMRVQLWLHEMRVLVFPQIMLLDTWVKFGRRSKFGFKHTGCTSTVNNTQRIHATTKHRLQIYFCLYSFLGVHLLVWS